MSANDYHLKGDELHPGLGSDEPSEEQKAGMKSAGAARLLRLKEEIDLASAELTDKEKKILAREQAAIEKEEALIARERALDAAENKKAAKKD